MLKYTNSIQIDYTFLQWVYLCPAAWEQKHFPVQLLQTTQPRVLCSISCTQRHGFTWVPFLPHQMKKALFVKKCWREDRLGMKLSVQLGMLSCSQIYWSVTCSLHEIHFEMTIMQKNDLTRNIPLVGRESRETSCSSIEIPSLNSVNLLFPAHEEKK